MNRVRLAPVAALAGARAAVRLFLGVVVAPATWFLLLTIAGLSLFVLGVAVLWGPGFGMLAAAVACIALAWLIQLGVKHGA